MMKSQICERVNFLSGELSIAIAINAIYEYAGFVAPDFDRLDTDFDELGERLKEEEIRDGNE